MKQRVAIARGMAMEPDMLLMDEPFAALDALTRRKMQEELLQLWDETRFTVLFVTHSIEEAITVGNRILVLSPHPGQVKAELDACRSARWRSGDGGIQGARDADPRPAVRRARRKRRRCPMAERRRRGAPGAPTREPVDAARSASSSGRCPVCERLANIAAVRKLVLLVVLALIWEVYARWLNNPLLFPTFVDDDRGVRGRACASGVLPAAR